MKEIPVETNRQKERKSLIDPQRTTCQLCGSPSHLASTCHMVSDQDTCQLCDHVGHSTKKCNKYSQNLNHFESNKQHALSELPDPLIRENCKPILSNDGDHHIGSDTYEGKKIRPQYRNNSSNHCTLGQTVPDKCVDELHLNPKTQTKIPIAAAITTPHINILKEQPVSSGFRTKPPSKSKNIAYNLNPRKQSINVGLLYLKTIAIKC